MSLRIKACKKIKNLITNGVLKPNDVLHETELAQRFGMSRTPIREAFQILEDEGLIQKFNNRGAIITKLDINDILEISQVREVIEGLAARLACGKIPQNKILIFEEKLKKEYEQYYKSINNENDSSSEKILFGTFLHKEILNSSCNKIIIKLSQTLNFQFHRMMVIAGNVVWRPEKALKEHLAIIEAFKVGNPDLAEKKMREHIVNVKNDLINSFIS